MNPTFNTLWMAIAVVIGPFAALTSSTFAQNNTATVNEPVAELPDAADVVGACLTLHRWVAAFDAPSPDLPAAALPIGNASAVYVALRQRGRVRGSGVDGGGDDRMIRRAAGRAMSAVLGDRTVANLPEGSRESLGASLTTELEVAGPLIPLPGRSFRRIAEQIEPGLDGVAMRRGEVTKFMFPAQMRATNTAGNLAATLPSLALELGLPARELSELTRRFNVRVYRFRTTHLVQRGPGRRPFETFRGDVIVSQGSMNADSIDDFAEGLVRHITTALWAREEPLGLMGDYRPIRDDYDPLIAPPRDQALIAYALARYGTALDAGPRAQQMRDTASVVLVQLAATTDGEIDPLSDPVACAAIMYAVSEMGDAANEPLVRGLYDNAVGVALDAFANDAFDASVSPHGQSMIAGALARVLAIAPGTIRARGADASLVRDAIDAAWGAVPDHQRVALLPWIAFAEVDHARALRQPAVNLKAIRTLRTLLNSSRIGAATSHGAPDLLGGFPLMSSGPARATAQTARPAVFSGWALRHPGLTEADERAVETGLHLRTMRFLRQLQVDDDLLWAFRGPLRVKGGLRAAPWDSDQPLAAQAMGLLAAAETLLSLQAVPENGPDGSFSDG